MNANARAEVVECLCELGSPEFQERVWVRGEGPEVSTYTEVICQLFDDTGLGDMLDSGAASIEFGPQAEASLLTLRSLLSQVPEGVDARSLFGLPIWRAVVEAARTSAVLVASG